MLATTDAIIALQGHGTEGVPHFPWYSWSTELTHVCALGLAQAVFNTTIAMAALERDAAGAL